MEPARYFIAGGTMEPKAASYVERRADHEVLAAISAGEFCYILTSRQMGKSSLFSRAALRLRAGGFRVCIVDLQNIGQTSTAAQWYNGMLDKIGLGFDLEDEIENFRRSKPDLGPQQVWLEALRRVLLERVRERILIIVDEIDYVRSLEFPTDDFFLGIRELYNRRANDPELNRLSFCLLGVASPGDLIENKDITPFNIGHRVDLRDFTLGEALQLAEGFPELPRPQAEVLVRRIYHWSGGQPFLTQKFCQAVAAEPAARDVAAIDGLASDLFLTQRARETEPHFAFIRDRLLEERTRNPALFERLMRLYQRLWEGSRVEDSEVSQEVTRLKLSGLVRGEDGCLAIKNPIYRENFSRRWVKAQLPVNWTRVAKKALAAAAIILLVACLPAAIIAWRAKVKAERLLAQASAQAAEARSDAKQAESDREKARQQALEAAREREKAESLNTARAKAFARVTRRELEQLWTTGRFVEGALLRTHVEEQFGATMASQDPELDKLARKWFSAPRKLVEGLQPHPGGWEPGRQWLTCAEPAGTFQLEQGQSVETIVPWPQDGSLLFVLGSRAKPNELTLQRWDLQAGPVEGDARWPLLQVGREAALAFGFCPATGVLAFVPLATEKAGAVAEDTPAVALVKALHPGQLTSLTAESAAQKIPPAQLVPPEAKIVASAPGSASHKPTKARPLKVPVLPVDPPDAAASEERSDRRRLALSFSPEGRYFVSLSSLGDVAVFEQSEDQAPYRLKRFDRASSRVDSGRTMRPMAIGHGGLLFLEGKDRGSVMQLDTGAPKPTRIEGNLTLAPDGEASLSDDDGWRYGNGFTWEYGGLSIRAESDRNGTANSSSRAFSPDQQWYAVGLADGNVSLGYRGQWIETIPAFAKPVRAVEFFPDGSAMVAADATGAVRIWRLHVEPRPVVPAGDQMALHAWQLTPQEDDELAFEAKPAVDQRWAEMRVSQPLAAAIQELWRPERELAGWFTNRPHPPDEQTVEHWRQRLAPVRAAFENAGRTNEHLMRWIILQEILEPTSRPDGPTLWKLRQLTEPQQWLLLSSKLENEGWRATPETALDLARLWVVLASLNNSRLSQHRPYKPAKDDFLERRSLPPMPVKPSSPMPPEWKAVLTRVQTARERAVKLGSRQPEIWSEFPAGDDSLQLAKWRKEVEKANSGLKQVGPVPDNRSDAERGADLDLLDRAWRNGACPDFQVLVQASADARELKDFRRAVENLTRAEAVSNLSSVGTVYLERAELFQSQKKPGGQKELDEAGLREPESTEVLLAEARMLKAEAKDGSLQKACDLMKLATDLAPNDDPTWARRSEFEVTEIDGKPNPPGLTAAIADLETLLGRVSGAEVVTWVLARQAGYWATLGETDAARRVAERCLKTEPITAANYGEFWDNWKSATESDAVWARQRLDEGIALAQGDPKWLAALLRHRADSRRDERVELREAVQDYLAALDYGWPKATRENILLGIRDVLRLLGLVELPPSTPDQQGFPENQLFLHRLRGVTLWHRGRHEDKVEAAAEFQKGNADSKVVKVEDYYLNMVNRAGALHDAGASAEALQLLIDEEAGAPPEHRRECWSERVQILADCAGAPGASATQRDEFEAALQNPPRAWGDPFGRVLSAQGEAALLRGDAVALRPEVDALRKRWPSSNYTRLREAILYALEGKTRPEQREMALARLAVAVASGWYDGFTIATFADYRALRELSEWPALATALKLDSLAQLADREDRLAVWMDSIQATNPDAQKLLRQSAAKCRERAEKDRANPLVVDWEKLMQPTAPSETHAAR